MEGEWERGSDEHFVIVAVTCNALVNYSEWSLVVQADAEEICQIFQQVFELVYTEATMDHLNSSITLEEPGSNFHSTPVVPTGGGERREEEGFQPRAPSSLDSAGPSSTSVTLTNSSTVVAQRLAVIQH